MSFSSAQHRYDMQEPSSKEGPTAEWEKAKDIVERCEEEERHDQWLHKATLVNGCYTGPSVWQGMTLQAQRRQERRMVRIRKVASHFEDIVSKDACPGCGGYSEGGHCCDHKCALDARFEG